MFPHAPLGGIDRKQFLFTKEGISTPEYSCSVGTMRVHLTLSQKTQARSFSLQMRDLQKILQVSSAYLAGYIKTVLTD